LLIVACGSDGNKSGTSSDGQELPPEKQAYYEDHGHDHDHEHSSDKPESIENNSRVRVPVDGNTKTAYKETPDNPAKTKSQMQIEARTKMQKGTRPVPDACTLLNEKQIAGVVGVDASAITLKDGSSSASPYARSCFFRWEHRGVPNSGVLLQVQDNPVPDEFSEWAAYYIQAKKDQGEKSPDGSLEFTYVDFDGVGVAGAYSYELHRYMWRDEKDFVYMIAFNLPASEAEEVEWATKLGKLVMNKIK